MKKPALDFIIIGGIILISLVSLLLISFLSKEGNLVAQIYYEDNLVKTIPLYEENEPRTFTIEGSLGEVVIEVKKNAIRVVSETSNYHYCSKVGFSSSPARPIICLPNNVYIKIIGESTNDIDIEVG